MLQTASIEYLIALLPYNRPPDLADQLTLFQPRPPLPDYLPMALKILHMVVLSSLMTKVQSIFFGLIHNQAREKKLCSREEGP